MTNGTVFRTLPSTTAPVTVSAVKMAGRCCMTKATQSQQAGDMNKVEKRLQLLCNNTLALNLTNPTRVTSFSGMICLSPTSKPAKTP